MSYEKSVREHIEKELSNLSKGPWASEFHPTLEGQRWFINGGEGYVVSIGGIKNEADARFMANSPIYVRWLLNRIKELEK